MRFGETLSLSRVDIVISRSGSPHDASHLPSLFMYGAGRSGQQLFTRCPRDTLHLSKAT